MQQVKIIDKSSGEVLFACSLEDIDKAYKFATEMEEVGLDLEIQSQTLTESLGRSLGMTEDQIVALKQVEEEEIDSHIDCCTIAPIDSK